MPERLNNGFIGYLSRLYKKLQKLLNNNK